MITDEQIDIVSKQLSISYADDEMRVRKALEAYEQSKWVRFDADDESTYPPFDVRVLTKLKGDFGVDMSIDFMAHNKEWYNAIRLRYVTHWQHLPTFKE